MAPLVAPLLTLLVLLGGTLGLRAFTAALGTADEARATLPSHMPV